MFSEKIYLKKISLIIIFSLLTAMGPSASKDNKGQISPFEIDKLDNTPAPDFTLKDINGKSLSLSSLRGKIVLLNFWATWCPPCKSEMPVLNKLYKDMRSRGLEIIAVSADNSINHVKDYLGKNNFDFRVLWDEDRIVTKKYKVFTMPTTFLIDRNGIIIDKFYGEEEWNAPEFKRRLEKL